MKTLIIGGSGKIGKYLLEKKNKNYINTYNKMSYLLDIPVGGSDKYNPHYCKVNDIINLKIFRMNLNKDYMSEIICNSLELSLPKYLYNSNFIVNNT